MAEWLLHGMERTKGSQFGELQTQNGNGYAMDDALIRDIAARIVEAFHPKRIILFGSRARGDYHADSDVDIFVEMDTPDIPVERRLKIRRLFRDRWWPMDILVYTPEEVRAREHTGASIVPDILKEGITLYEQDAQR